MHAARQLRKLIGRRRLFVSGQLDGPSNTSSVHSLQAPIGPARRMRLVSWNPLRKNALRGFATVELPIGLTIADVPVLISRGKAWANLPSKPQIDACGQHRRDANGKPAYTAMLSCRDRHLSDRFSAAVVELVRRQHPEALAGEGAS
jgi:hypothetical protein